jgi:hypothetical protein
MTPSEMLYEAVNALKQVSRMDPPSLTCGPNAPQDCENGCVGCAARKGLLAVGLYPSWPDIYGWHSLEKESLLPCEANLVFITDGKDMGIGSWMGGSKSWKLFSGHSIHPTHWKTIEFPKDFPS